MEELTPKAFKLQYKKTADQVFDLKACLNDTIKKELYTQTQGKSLVKLHYGLLGDRFFYAIRIEWCLVKFVPYGRITKVILFKDYGEQFIFRSEARDQDAGQQKPGQN